MQISNQLGPTGSERKNVHGKDFIKLCPLGLVRLTRCSSLSHWLNPRCSSNNLLLEINLKNDIRLEIFCSPARDTEINDLNVLTNWSCYISGFIRVFFVSNANLKSTESKNVHGKDYIKLYPLGLFFLTRSSSLSH